MKIVPLTPDYNLTTFDCGDSDLNEFRRRVFPYRWRALCTRGPLLRVPATVKPRVENGIEIDRHVIARLLQQLMVGNVRTEFVGTLLQLLFVISTGGQRQYRQEGKE